MDTQSVSQLVLFVWISLAFLAWFKNSAGGGLFERIIKTIFFPFVAFCVIAGASGIAFLLYFLTRLALGFGV